MKLRGLGLCCAAALAAALPLAADAQTGSNSAAQALAWFNAQRAANGIPGDVSENADWSAKCDAHITYMQKSGQFQHEEDQGSPFYSVDGEWGGTHSVLSMGDTWSADHNPWETAPIHLAQMMSPQLAEMGIADRASYVCATTWPGFSRPIPDQMSVVTYPGNGTTIYAEENAAESPFTPEDIVGLTGPTGPNLYAYLWGPPLRDYYGAYKISVTAAALTGTEGDVPVKWVDHTTARIGPYLPEASGILMPVHPLANGAEYQASVTFSDGTQHKWSFKTRVLANKVTVSGKGARKLDRVHWVPGVVQVSSSAPNPVITVTLRGKPVSLRFKRDAGDAEVIGRQVKTGMRVCASSGGGTSGYGATSACKSI